MIVSEHHVSFFSAISWQEHVTFLQDDDCVCFVLDIHAFKVQILYC